MDEKENIENLNSNQDGIEIKPSSMEDALEAETSDVAQEKSAADKALDDFLFSDEPIEEIAKTEEVSESEGIDKTEEIEKIEQEEQIETAPEIEDIKEIEKIEELEEEKQVEEVKQPQQKEEPTIIEKVDDDLIEQSDELITVRPVKFPQFEQTPPIRTIKKNLDIMQDVSMHVSVELGRTKSSIREVMEMEEGSIVELDKIAGEQVEVFVNDKLVAKGEVIVIEDKFGVRITSTNIVKNNA